jgi:hypothetical protein
MKPFIFAAAAFAVFSSPLYAAVPSNVVVSPVQKPITSGDPIDYAHAIPMPVPTLQPGTVDVSNFSDSSSGVAFAGAPGFSPGGVGSGKELSLRLVPAGATSPGSGTQPTEFGTSDHTFTTSRVDLNGNMLSKTYPFSAAGKLFFKIGADSYVCSASLIQPGVIVTAAHCVTSFGGSGWYSDWTFVPAYNNGAAPFGKWKGSVAAVMSSSYLGTDSCATPGVICENDVAVITLPPQKSLIGYGYQTSYAGNLAGWLGYGWDGYGFNVNGKALFTQLGYPVSHDSGGLMQRTESQTNTNANLSNNSVWGSRQTGGSSGGPEVVNLGHSSVLSDGVTYGSDAAFNTVVGVTSWGYTDQAIKKQGASKFLSTNIGVLVPLICSFDPAACL